MTEKTQKPKSIVKSIKKKDKFDAVKMMREIRDKISKDIKGMTFEEEQAYLEKIIANKKA